MTSPYYNYPSAAAYRAVEMIRKEKLTAPIEYDTCSVCGCDDTPTTDTLIDDEVIVNCNDCQLPPQRAGAMPPGSWDAKTIGFSIDDNETI